MCPRSELLEQLGLSERACLQPIEDLSVMSEILDKRRASAGACACLLLAASCGGKLTVDSIGVQGSGGGSSLGGDVGSGGATDGGVSSTGGVTASGGSAGSRGVGSGGEPTGGTSSMGGSGTGGAASGGLTSTGGTAGASGGIAASGGASGTGGGGAADAGHCFDGKRDSTESDIDCGGECAGCGPGQVCYFDNDCSATAPGCDQCYCDAYTSTCVSSHCYDHKKDANETDLDCGGGTCGPCSSGLACLVDADCSFDACDTLRAVCTSNQCADHHRDGQETDIDCGGPACNSCLVGMTCHNSIDCQSGHFCNALKVCQ